MTQESIDAFDVRAQCFVDQYNAFHPPEVADPTVTVSPLLYANGYVRVKLAMTYETEELKIRANEESFFEEWIRSVFLFFYIYHPGSQKNKNMLVRKTWQSDLRLESQGRI